LKKYNIIYADPPWSYSDKMKGHQGAETHYRTMDNNDICALPVQELADKDCCLFMWAVSPLLPEAMDVINSWGFKYKTVAFCWSKISSGGTWVSNMGRWTMGNIELCLLATKGNPHRAIPNVKQLVVAQRTVHSKKPDVVRKRIVELMGDLPRIELFARDNGVRDMFNYSRLDGWDAWGNEAGTDVELPQVIIDSDCAPEEAMDGIDRMIKDVKER